MNSSVDYTFGSFKGLNRNKNKDFIKIIENNNYILFLLFDGVSSSEYALSAIETIVKFIEDETKSKYLFKIDLEKLIFEANNYLLNSKVEEGFSTYAAVYFEKNDTSKSYYVSSLGDTRVYTIQKQFLTQLTKDDRLINSSNIVTKFLGMLQYSSKDFLPKEYQIKNCVRLIMCSDGFSSFIEDEKLRVHRILNFKRIKNVKKYLDKLISNNNQDDASYIFINIRYV